MGFFRDHWSKDHILARDRAFVDWQYFDAQRSRYNFAVATATGMREIHGVLGFIPTSHYDPMLAGCDTLWLTMWKVRNDSPYAGLGLCLHGFVAKALPCQVIATVGNNAAVAKLYRALGYQTGQLGQYYIVNPELREFALLRPESSSPKAASSLKQPKRRLEALGLNDFSAESAKLEAVLDADVFPRKSAAYLLRRYLRHPIYEYQVFKVTAGDQFLGLLVIRKVTHSGASALRIVDYLGTPLGFAGLGPALTRLLTRQGGEYIDLLNFGIDPELLLQAGFRRLDPTREQIIIPNYYEPFEKRNAVIQFAYKAKRTGRYVAFKGDCDQDRPSGEQ